MPRNELELITKTVGDLQELVENSIIAQVEFNPVFEGIMTKILVMLDKEDELASWEGGDLIKLLNLANKARLAPVEQLTKLVQAVQTLHETSELQSKITDLADVVEELRNGKKSVEDVIDLVDADEGTNPKDMVNVTVEDLES